MDQATSQRVLETVWPWKATPTAGAPSASTRPRPVRGLIQALVMGAIGLLLFRYVGHRVMGYIVWSLAIFVLGSSMFVPRVFDGIEGFGRRLGLWVGTGLTYLLLVPFFYLVFVPGRLVLWMLRKDPMQRAFPSPETSCWAPRRTKMDDRHYRKQFS